MSQLIFARNRVKTCLLQNYFAQNSIRSFRTSPMKFSKENVNKGKLNEFSRLLGMAKPDKKKIAGWFFSILSSICCSPDPTTNFKSTNPDCPRILYPIRLILTKKIYR